MRQLDGRATATDRAASVPAVTVPALDRLRGMFGPVRCTAIADPEADAERSFTPESVGLRDRIISQAAMRGGGALKLLQRQQAQRIAHEHCDARHAIKPAEISLQTSYRHGVGGEPQISFRLAAASRKPDQIGISQFLRIIAATLGMTSDRSSPED